MLTLTENATTIIRYLADATDDSATAGLRILTIDAPENKFTIEIAPAPEPGDKVVSADGARVFLDRLAAPRLSHKELDALVEQDNVKFSLRNQS
ncbi:hypothetical protein BH11ACT4_BH11ACT4_25600 [soil metagenome]